jgi:hydrogenase-4 component E
MASELELALSVGIIVITIIIMVNNQVRNQLIWFITQTVVLGLLALTIGIAEVTTGGISLVEGLNFVAIAVITIAVKAIAIPAAIFKAIKRINLDASPDEQPKAFTVSVPRSIIVAFILVLLSYLIVQPVLVAEPVVLASITTMLLPASFAIVLIGLYMAATAKKVYGQLIALLVMENGIYFASVSTIFEFPAIVDIGILFDVFAAIMILVIFLIAIHRSFDTIQVNKLNELKE